MKKALFSIFITLLCTGAVASTYFMLDHNSPRIKTNGKPSLACSVSFDDLLVYASASDDKALKSFFIEEKSLNTIADNGYLTFVAIDDSNNVSKKQIAVDVEPSLKRYHIDILKPLRFQVNEMPMIDDYIRLRNDCGWDEEGYLVIEGINYNKFGEYEVNIRSKKHPEVENLEMVAEVGDLHIPKIILNTSYDENVSRTYFDDAYFTAFIEDVQDDLDMDLIDSVECDWRDVLSAAQSGYVSTSGTYIITYSVTDSDMNTGTAQLTIILKAPVITEEDQEG